MHRTAAGGFDQRGGVGELKSDLKINLRVFYPTFRTPISNLNFNGPSNSPPPHSEGSTDSEFGASDSASASPVDPRPGEFRFRRNAGQSPPPPRPKK